MKGTRNGPRRALACPDSFKEVLSAADAAAAIAAGLAAAGFEAKELPLADGGEGTAEALARGARGEWRLSVVADPLGRPVEARYWMGEDGEAVLDAAEAIGLHRLRAEERDPLRASSRGLGELLLAALEGGAHRVVVGLGGTATVDGGAGCLEVVQALPVPVTAAHDVDNPLLGARGAARIFGPQKGASPEAVEELERRLAAAAPLRPFARLAGAGAAGGLGAALASLGASLRPGIEVVLEALHFEDALAGADLVVTGEGAVDPSSAGGKVPAGVARACARAGIPCVVLGGRVDGGVESLYELGATAVLALSGRPARAREDLAAAAEAVGRLVLRE